MLSIVEKETMAHCTISELAHGMAHGGHIHNENYKFIGIEGLEPTTTFSRSLDLHPRDLGSMV